MLTDQTATALLEPIAATLRADGYDLAVHLDGQLVAIEVSATPTACAECLVPKELMGQLINDALCKEDPAYGTREMRISYPADLQAH
jgi:hypothetical protein